MEIEDDKVPEIQNNFDLPEIQTPGEIKIEDGSEHLQDNSDHQQDKQIEIQEPELNDLQQDFSPAEPNIP